MIYIKFVHVSSDEFSTTMVNVEKKEYNYISELLQEDSEHTELKLIPA